MGNVTLGTLDECERTCRQNLECQTFSHLVGLCYHFSIYTGGFSHQESTSGYCLTLADTESPSTIPVTSPTFNPTRSIASVTLQPLCRCEFVVPSLMQKIVAKRGVLGLRLTLNVRTNVCECRVCFYSATTAMFYTP